MSGTHTYFELLGGGKNIIKNKFELDESRRGLLLNNAGNVVAGDIQGGMYRLYYHPYKIKRGDTQETNVPAGQINNLTFKIDTINGRPMMFNEDRGIINYFMQKVYEHSPPRWPFSCVIKISIPPDDNVTGNTRIQNNRTGAEGIIAEVEQVTTQGMDKTIIFVRSNYVLSGENQDDEWWKPEDKIKYGQQEVVIETVELIQTYYMKEHLDLAAAVPNQPNGNPYPLYISNNNTVGIANAFQPLEEYDAADTRMVNAPTTRRPQNGQLETIVNPLNGSPISYRDGNNLLMQPEFRDFTTMYKYCAVDGEDENRRFNSLPLSGGTNSIEHALSIISDNSIGFTCHRLTNENTTAIANDALEFARKTKNQVENRDNLEEHIVRWSEQNPTQSMYKKRYGKKKPQTQRSQNQNGNELRTRINKQVSINQHAFQKRVNTVHGRVNLSYDYYLSKNNMHRLVAGGLRNLFHRTKRDIINGRQERFTFYRTTPIHTENTNTTFPLTIRFAKLIEEGNFTHFLQLVEAQPISLENDQSGFHENGVVNIENPQQFVKMHNKYKSKVKHWISSGNTGGTYGVPALCAGANIYRKGGTRPSKRVKNSGKKKQCNKLKDINNFEILQKKQALEEYNLRRCNDENFNDMYKASNFKDFEDNRYRAYTIFEALDIVCVPHILQGGGLSKEDGEKFEALTPLEGLILQSLRFENMGQISDYVRNNNIETFRDFSNNIRDDGYYDIMRDSYPDVRRNFENYLLNLLSEARSIAKNEGKSNVTGTHILQALYSSDDSEAYKKRINNASDDEFVVDVTTDNEQHGLYKYSFTKSPGHHFALGDLIQIKRTESFENEVSFLLQENVARVSTTTTI